MHITPIHEEYILLRFKNKSVGDNHYYLEGWSDTTNKLVDASDYSQKTSQDRIDRLLETAERFGISMDELEWVRVKRVQTFSSVPINETQLLETRRRRALAKLGPEDIEALGVESLMIYEKLKTHNVSDDDDHDFCDIPF